MSPSKATWIWLRNDWPHLTYDAAAARRDLADAYSLHGVIEGKAQAIGLTGSSEIPLEAMASEVVATAAIEGERLALDAVRSSVMRRLGLVSAAPHDRHIDGLVAVLSDATTAPNEPLDQDRLCRWHAALFPGGTSGIRRIAVGRYRDHADPMQIVSGAPGREVVHYEAPPSKDVTRHMNAFLQWLGKTSPVNGRLDPAGIDGLARAAIAHLWFESIHPFEDGNGRIGRAIVDMVVAQHMHAPIRLYSLSRQLLASRAAYYDRLNMAQRGGLDVTDWVTWFARQCTAAFATTNAVIDKALEKRRFWEQHGGSSLSERQRKVLQRLLDDGDGGFLGGLNAEKYMKLTGTSKATATRDLAQMTRDGQLWSAGQGKGVRYYVAVPGWTHGVSQSSS